MPLLSEKIQKFYTTNKRRINDYLNIRKAYKQKLNTLHNQAITNKKEIKGLSDENIRMEETIATYDQQKSESIKASHIILIHLELLLKPEEYETFKQSKYKSIRFRNQENMRNYLALLEKYDIQKKDYQSIEEHSSKKSAILEHLLDLRNQIHFSSEFQTRSQEKKTHVKLGFTHDISYFIDMFVDDKQSNESKQYLKQFSELQEKNKHLSQLIKNNKEKKIINDSLISQYKKMIKQDIQINLLPLKISLLKQWIKLIEKSIDENVIEPNNIIGAEDLCHQLKLIFAVDNHLDEKEKYNKAKALFKKWHSEHPLVVETASNYPALASMSKITLEQDIYASISEQDKFILFKKAYFQLFYMDDTLIHSFTNLEKMTHLNPGLYELLEIFIEKTEPNPQIDVNHTLKNLISMLELAIGRATIKSRSIIKDIIKDRKLADLKSIKSRSNIKDIESDKKLIPMTPKKIQNNENDYYDDEKAIGFLPNDRLTQNNISKIKDILKANVKFKRPLIENYLKQVFMTHEHISSHLKNKLAGHCKEAAEKIAKQQFYRAILDKKISTHLSSGTHIKGTKIFGKTQTIYKIAKINDFISSKGSKLESSETKAELIELLEQTAIQFDPPTLASIISSIVHPLQKSASLSSLPDSFTSGILQLDIQSAGSPLKSPFSNSEYRFFCDALSPVASNESPRISNSSLDSEASKKTTPLFDSKRSFFNDVHFLPTASSDQSPRASNSSAESQAPKLMLSLFDAKTHGSAAPSQLASLAAPSRSSNSSVESEDSKLSDLKIRIDDARLLSPVSPDEASRASNPSLESQAPKLILSLFDSKNDNDKHLQSIAPSSEPLPIVSASSNHSSQPTPETPVPALNSPASSFFVAPSSASEAVEAKNEVPLPIPPDHPSQKNGAAPSLFTPKTATSSAPNRRPPPRPDRVQNNI
jgi:hypothetical protein